MWKLAFAFVLLILAGCSDKGNSSAWCDSRTVANLKSLSGSSPSTNWCATVQGNLVYRKDATRCRQGAYYLEDSTGSIFVCDPNKPAAVTDSGAVSCASAVLKFAADTTLLDSVRAEGLYYPAKTLCQSASFCWCQNGLDVDRIERLN